MSDPKVDNRLRHGDTIDAMGTLFVKRVRSSKGKDLIILEGDKGSLIAGISAPADGSPGSLYITFSKNENGGAVRKPQTFVL